MFISPGAKRSETVNCIIHQPNGTFRFGFLFDSQLKGIDYTLYNDDYISASDSAGMFVPRRR